jgi:type I restriction enzyme S subunit
MSEWISKKLSDLTTKIGSGATPRGGSSVYTSIGVALIRSQNVLDNAMKSLDIARISDHAARSLSGVTIEPGDVLINITGDSIARCAVVDPALLPARVNQHVAILRTISELDSRFLQRFLVNPSFKDGLIASSSGGTRNALTKAGLGALVIEFPPLPEQRAIAEVLGALDDKIAANTKLAATAEEFAIASLFGESSMVPLREVVRLHRNTVSPDSIDDGQVDHFSLPAFDAGVLPTLDSPRDIKSAKFRLDRPVVLLSKLNPRFPRVWNVESLDGQPALASTEFLVLAWIHRCGVGWGRRVKRRMPFSSGKMEFV